MMPWLTSAIGERSGLLYVGGRHGAAQDAGRDPDALKTAMRINLEPGTSVDSLAGKLKRLAESGTDEAFVDAFAVFPSLDQTLDFASKLIAHTGRL
jgi:hypothetical protein